VVTFDTVTHYYAFKGENENVVKLILVDIITNLSNDFQKYEIMNSARS